MDRKYTEFAVASNFSFLHGASHPEELMAEAARLGLGGLALADRNSVAGVVRAHVARRESELKIRYHPGARLVLADGTPDILAYPRDRAGWGRLCRLLTRGNLRTQKGDCVLYLDDLLEHAQGLELVVMAGSTRDADAEHTCPTDTARPSLPQGQGDCIGQQRAAGSTSPRVRGEVDRRRRAGEGAPPSAETVEKSPSPRPSPREERGEGEEAPSAPRAHVREPCPSRQG
jgi:PHP domain